MDERNESPSEDPSNDLQSGYDVNGTSSGNRPWWKNAVVIVPIAAAVIGAFIAGGFVILQIVLTKQPLTPEITNIRPPTAIHHGDQIDIIGRNLDLVSEVILRAIDVRGASLHRSSISST